MRVHPFPIRNWNGEVNITVIKSLCLNKSLIIILPDKGSWVVVLNHHNYVDKMMVILSDASKFVKLGSVANHNLTATLKTKFQKQLMKWIKGGVLPSDIVKWG